MTSIGHFGRGAVWLRPAARACTLAAVLATLSASLEAETLEEIGARLGRDTEVAFTASPYSVLSKDYFARFVRDPEAKAGPREVEITSDWSIAVDAAGSIEVERMAGYLQEFLRGFGADVRIESNVMAEANTILLTKVTPANETLAKDESFDLVIHDDKVRVFATNTHGLRDAVVELVDRMGFRGAPILGDAFESKSPRLAVRLGTVPKGGSYRDLVFMGYNAVFSGGGSLYSLSTSGAIPELAVRRQPGLLEKNRDAAAEARAHGLKTYAFLDIRQKFPEDDPVFAAHPEIRGARTWRVDGEFVLCTEHPLVQQWLTESIQGLFKADPDLSGIVLIIGGEGFYHCFMRPFGVEKGHTNCSRCEALGAETVVANLCNRLAAAARSVSPEAEVVVWPYSAEHVWSADKTQEALIEKLKPGVALLTEIEKDEYVQKPGGVTKHLWDYSIDLIGPGVRANTQIEACRRVGINVYLKSEPELGFEAPRLPHIPCMDRWVDRAEALASCGATGAWVFPAFRPNYGTSAAEISKYVWWKPAPDKEELLNRFAGRLFGAEAGPHMRVAWRAISRAIEYTPVIPPYYTGPQYLGPAQPMIADPDTPVPDVFYGYYLFMAEITDSEGVKTRPTFMTKPYGDAEVFVDYYRKMEAELETAVFEAKYSDPLVDDAHRLMFNSEVSAIRWLYATARTTANFYESCILRDKLLACAHGESADWPVVDRSAAMKRWREILENERENTLEAIPYVEQDYRLDCYYGSDHTFSHAADMMRVKLEMLEIELNEFLPKIAAECGVTAE